MDNKDIQEASKQASEMSTAFKHRGRMIQDGPPVGGEETAVSSMNRQKRFNAELVALRHHITDCAKRLDVLAEAVAARPKKKPPPRIRKKRG